MRTQIPKLHKEEYEYIKQIADKLTIVELETLIKDLKKEQYHDYKGNTGLIQSLERAIDVKNARESRNAFKEGRGPIENVYWSIFEEVEEAEEAAYLNLVDSHYGI